MSSEPATPEPSTPELSTERPDDIVDGLRKVADWMDEADRLIDRAFADAGMQRRNQGDDVQQDMRRLADWFQSHPEQAADAWSYINQRPVTGQHPADAPGAPNWGAIFGVTPDSSR